MQPNISPFNILILGDGDFSFTLAFCNKLKFSTSLQFPLLSLLQKYCDPSNTATLHVITTSFDDKKQLLGKYPNSDKILMKLDALNDPSNKQRKKERNLKFRSKDPLINLQVTIRHNVDATDLSIFHDHDQFNLIIFNHPHLGCESIHRNGSLVLHILSESNHILTADGQIWITLLQHQFKHWQIQRKMESNALNMRLHGLGGFAFFDGYYPGFTTKRHQSGKSFRRNRPSQRALNENAKQSVQSMTFVFTPSSNNEDQIKNDEESQLHSNSLLEYLDAMNESVRQCIDKEQNEQETFCCNRCGRTFLEERSLKNHQKSSGQCIQTVIETEQEMKDNMMIKFECGQCEKSFRSEQGLAQHVLVKHDSLNDDIKPDWYLGKGGEDLNANKMDEQCQGLENKVKCLLCERGFRDKNEHKKWITPTMTEENEEFKCDQCRERTFVSKRDLLQHSNVCNAK